MTNFIFITVLRYFCDHLNVTKGVLMKKEETKSAEPKQGQDSKKEESFADKHSPKQSDNASSINEEKEDIDTSAADGGGVSS